MFIIERYIVVYNTKHHYTLLHIEIFYYFMKSFPVQTFFFAIVLSVLLQFMVSDYPFAIFKLLLNM
jgi:hypothetical protein